MIKRIEIDQSAGFCFGVEKAIETAEEKLDKGLKVYGLGKMVHNEREIHRLDSLGLKVITTSDFNTIGPAKVIFRAHGEPPSTYRKAEENNIEIIDTTCPIVKSLQKKIREKYNQMDPLKEQIVIFGKTDHPETIGLVGQTNGEAIVISDPGDIDAIDPDKIISLYSQTTMDPEEFKTLEDNISRAVSGMSSERLIANCTICHQMKKRKPHLKEFSLNNDVILFVSGKSSSNGMMLYNYCKLFNENSYWIHSGEEIDPDWLKGFSSVGISGATSTPLWQLEEIKKYLESLTID